MQTVRFSIFIKLLNLIAKLNRIFQKRGHRHKIKQSADMKRRIDIQ